VSASRERFQATVSGSPDLPEAALAVDSLVLGLLEEHFRVAGGGFDADAYLDAIERFATDVLPACPERSAQLPDDAPRKPFSFSHRMAGDIMWFAWATQLECAELVAPTQQERAARALFMAGVALGCSMDYSTTGRCRTRVEYATEDAQSWHRIWERARHCARDFDRAAAEVERAVLHPHLR